MAWGHLENTGLTSGCSCDSSLGVPGEAGHPQADPAQPCSCLPSLLHISARVTRSLGLTGCTGQRAGTRMNQIYVISPCPRFLQA